MSFAYYSLYCSKHGGPLFSVMMISQNMYIKNLRTAYEDAMLSCTFRIMHMMTSL